MSVFAFALAAATMPQAATLSLSHPYGELVDRDATRAYFEASPPDRVDCTIAPVVQRAATGTAIEIVVRRVAPGAQAPICIAPNEVSLGVLSAGWWTVTSMTDPREAAS